MFDNERLPFPFNQHDFELELWEKGNAPDYSLLSPPGYSCLNGRSLKATRWNNPKNDPVTTIEVTGETNVDMMIFNYIKIDHKQVGGGVKYYFVTSKTIMNYPDIHQGNWFCVRYELRLDVWETYKEQIQECEITLEQVTTNSPATWSDISMLEQDIVPFSGTQEFTSESFYYDWKTIVGWQSSRPTEQDNFIIDGMRTTLQFNSTGSTTDYLNGMDDLAHGTLAETNIWRSYTVCNTYMVMDNFATTNGGRSRSSVETLNVPYYTGLGTHNRINYFPYRRAFIQTVDGQEIEIDYKKWPNNRLHETLVAMVNHSTVPSPTTTIQPLYPDDIISDIIIFKAYPSMDFTGRDITPFTQLWEGYKSYASTMWSAVTADTGRGFQGVYQ